MKDDLATEIDRLVSRMIDDQLSDADRSRLNELLTESPAAVIRYQQCLDNHEALCSIYPGEIYSDSLQQDESQLDSLPKEFAPNEQQSDGDGTITQGNAVSPASPRIRSLAHRFVVLTTAAALLIAVGLTGYFVGSDQETRLDGNATTTAFASEQTIRGHAMLRRSLGLTWFPGTSTYRDGDVLPGGELHIQSGIAEIDFFCGATLTVEGPALLNVQSDWSVKMDSGRLRANVPPAARGFVVYASESEIIDLGTEFALDIDGDSARVEVIDGEVALRGGKHDGVHLTTGQHQWLGEADSATEEPLGGRTLVSNSADMGRRRENAQAERFAQWQTHSRERQQDERLIAYYPIAYPVSQMQSERLVKNAANTGKVRDAALVGPAQRSTGRFGQLSSGIEFDRVGARARTRIDGEYNAFTFTTWARIDSLDHVYNSLFMSDGYETGDLHWQIRNDGALMFSVMVDDTQEIEHFSQRDGSVVRSAGLAHVYHSKPFWDISQSGRWFHLAAVYDPAARKVTQYVNGKQVSSEPIIERFFIDQLRIGPAEIGNWGQPFRQTPWFAVRNLNGTIDEMAIYHAALAPDELKELYEQGKPLGY